MIISSKSRNRLRIYLANFTYSPTHTNVDGIPLSIGDLAAALQASFGNEIEIKLFIYPTHFEDEVNRNKPDIVGFTNYVWNENLSSAYAAYIKRLDPNILVLMGGPNFPLDLSEQKDFLSTRENIDLYAIFEGERTITAIIDSYINNNGDINRIKSDQIAGCAFMMDDSGFISTKPRERISNLDEIPSPYLTGLLDQFFDGYLMPNLQASRGCPFTCSFCNEGVEYLNKVRRFSSERVVAELDYIGYRIHSLNLEVSAITFVDDNFLMYKEDEAIVDKILELQRKYGFPKKIFCNTGKNSSARILNLAGKLHNTLDVAAAVQSMDQGVLKAIKRGNIKDSVYFDVVKSVRERGLQATADTILGLPTETKKSYLDGLRKLSDLKIQTILLGTLYLAMGSPLQAIAEREKYQLKGHWRAAQGSIAEVDGKVVIEPEEIVTSTSTMSFEEWSDCRNLQLWVYIFSTGAIFEPLRALLAQNGVNFIDFLLEMRKRLKKAPENIQKLIENYEKATRSELYDTKEELFHAYNDEGVVERVEHGEIGCSLLNKYGSKAILLELKSFILYAQAISSELLKGEKYKIRQLESVIRYIIGVHAMSSSIVDVKETVDTELNYDIDKWKSDHYATELEACAFKDTHSMSFRLDNHLYQHIATELDNHGTSTIGLMKILRHLLPSHMHRNKVEFVTTKH